MKFDIVKKVMTKHKTHNLFVIDRFCLFPEANKAIQALTGRSIGELCHNNRPAVKILQEDLTNGADAMAELSTRHVF
jgi:hypothetical protein